MRCNSEFTDGATGIEGAKAMKTLRTVATVGIIGAVAAYASTAQTEQRNTDTIKIQLASTMTCTSAPGGYKWKRNITAATTPAAVAASAITPAPAHAGYKWASASESATDGTMLMAERADRGYARSGVAGEPGYKWGIRSISDPFFFIGKPVVGRARHSGNRAIAGNDDADSCSQELKPMIRFASSNSFIFPSIS